jgi:hypothetical protein
MSEEAPGPDMPIRRAIEQELESVEAAIDLVASGRSRRVAIGGLRFGEQLLGPARRLASEAGVRIVPLWPADEVGPDLAVERIDDR